ncbi:MAG: GspE/PulE family protein [Planctomycetota bacterium]
MTDHSAKRAIVLACATLFAGKAHAFGAASVLAIERGPGQYLSWFWIVILFLFFIVWYYILDWMAKDLVFIGEPPEWWNLSVFSAGVLVLILPYVLSPPALWFLLGLGAFAGSVGFYVHFRNGLVVKDERVLTNEHLAQFFSRIGMGGKARARATPKEVVPVMLFKKVGDEMRNYESTREQSEAVTAFKNLLAQAITSRATDIHIEPKPSDMEVRFRIDGILHPEARFTPDLGGSIIQAVKVLSEMDISEKRRAQEGNFAAALLNKQIDIRVATHSQVHGEGMVLRLLDKNTGLIELEKLGMPKNIYATLKKFCLAPHGMLLVSGPTGSGKSTTLYASLLTIDAYERNVITLENPVEYQISNIRQTAINPKAGITFASELRSLLRQDPDVVMIGEIRDTETAKIAMQAAQTGHLVFSTVHANDSVSTLFRLLDLGVEPYLISSAVRHILAQRLVRVLCESCKVAYHPAEDVFKKLRIPPREDLLFYKASGCENCQNTGFRGRTGLYEMFALTDEIRELLTKQPSVTQIRDAARRTGLKTLQEAGIACVLAGRTSLKEVVRVTAK